MGKCCPVDRHDSLVAQCNEDPEKEPHPYDGCEGREYENSLVEHQTVHAFAFLPKK